MPAVATDKMLAEKTGHIGRMIFNNPERHNAVSLEMWDAAVAILEDFAKDENIRVVVLSGAGGKSFVSGADISKFEKERGSKEAVEHYNARVAAAYGIVNHFPKPTIAEINGYCIGGGLGLAISCDLRFCSAKSKFGLPAAKLGLGYGFDAVKRLVDAIGPGATRDIVFTGRQLDSDEARTVGIVQKIVAEEELSSFVTDYANTICSNAPLTVRALKYIVNETLKSESDRDLGKCQAMVDAAFASEDYKEGRLAFMEKRKPQFTGR
ncbi:MAG: enoyl-CoA hydratase [Beijerinckiaceae bacterium]